jgi:hypothetical protein
MLIASSVKAEVSINGFGSVKAGKTSGDKEELYGYTSKLDFNNESLFALQLQSDLGEDLSVTAQLLGRGKDDFNVGFEWAFVSYQINSEWKVNAGKILTPFFKYSDYRNVGYAYVWNRTPMSVYNLGFDTMDGISVYQTTTLGDFDSSLQLVFGNSQSKTNIDGFEADSKVDGVKGITWDIGRENVSARLAYLVGDVSIDAQPLTPLLTLMRNTGLSHQADLVEVKDDASTFIGLSLAYDGDLFFAGSEYTFVESKNNFIAKLYSYYVNVGYKVTPDIHTYILYENDRDVAPDSIYADIPAVHPLFSTVKDFVDSQNVRKDTWSVGMRYNIHSSAVVKFQYTKEKDKLLNQDTANVSLGLDFVF